MNRFLDAILVRGLPEKDKRNANRVNLWAFGWMLSLLALSLLGIGEKRGLSLVALALLALHVLCGLCLILSYRRFLRLLDEMERKIQLEALALSVGVTIVAFSTASVLGQYNVIPPINAAALVALMALTYMGGLIVGRLRLT